MRKFFMMLLMLLLTVQGVSGKTVLDWQPDGAAQVIAEQAVTPGQIWRLESAWRIIAGDGRVMIRAIGFDKAGKKLFSSSLAVRNRAFSPEDFSVEKNEYHFIVAKEKDKGFTSTGSWFNNYILPENTAKLQIALFPGGNAVKAELLKVKFSPAASANVKLPQNYPSLPQPQPLSDAELDRILASRIKSEIKAVYNGGDKVEFYLNGKTFQPKVYKSTGWDKEGRFTAIHHFGKAGFNIFTIPFPLGASTHTDEMFGLWDESKPVNVQNIRKVLRRHIRMNPHALFMLDIGVTPPPGWGMANPDEILQNSKGEYGIFQKSRVSFGSRIPQDFPEKRAFPCPSYASEKFQREAGAALERLIKVIETIPEGKVIVGTYLNGGTDGQWLDLWDNKSFSGNAKADYSPASLRGYREYLKKKYGTPENMAKEYKLSKLVPFEAFNIPTEDEIWNKKKFFHSTCGSSAVTDYYEFTGFCGARRFHIMASAVKKASRNRLLTGAYSPNGGMTGFPFLAQQSMTWILDDPAIDFCSIVPGYMREHVDPIISSGFTGSLRRHNKFVIHELDLRTAEVGNWGRWSGKFWRDNHNADTFDRKVMLYTVHGVIHGGAYHATDMDGGWFNTPRAMAAWKRANEFVSRGEGLPETSERIAVAGMERYWDFQSHGRGRLNAYRVREALAPVLQKSAIPFDYHLLEDVLRTPGYKLPKIIMFSDLSTISSKQFKELRKRYCCDGRILVYFWKPGIFKERGVFPGLKPARAGRGKYIAVKPGVDDPLIKGLSGRFMDNYPYYGMDFPEVWGIYGKNWKTLGVFEGSSIPALAVRRAKNYTEIYVSLPGMLTVDFCRNIIKEAGMVPLVDKKDYCGFGGGLFYILAQSDGVRNITLPSGHWIIECGSGHKYSGKDGLYQVTLKTGELFTALIGKAK